MVYISGGNELLDPMKILTELGVKTGSVVADLGCGGAGHFVIPAAKIVGEKTNVYAVDILKSVLRSVTSIGRLGRVHNIKTIWADLETVGSTKIPKESLDFALLINTLFLCKQHDKVLQEAYRLLKSGGRLLVIEWLPIEDGGKGGKKLFRLGPAASDRVAADTVKQIAKNLNLKPVAAFKAGAYHYGLTYQK